MPSFPRQEQSHLINVVGVEVSNNLQLIFGSSIRIDFSGDKVLVEVKQHAFVIRHIELYAILRSIRQRRE
jgi:hypothetical protein